MQISINTPTQGVTVRFLPVSLLPDISINTPTQGVTDSERLYVRINVNFNQHSHAGSDTLGGSNAIKIIISINTPTQGVTAANRYNGTGCIISINTPTQGVTCLYPDI